MSPTPHRPLVGVLLLALVLACGGTEEPLDEDPVGVGAESPTAAVDDLITHLNTPDFEAAAHLAMPGHAALAALAEGATFSEVAGALRDGGAMVSANFWSGFAQGTGRFLTGEVTTAPAGNIEQDGVAFDRVQVVASDGRERVVLIRESNGHRIDLFASFGAGLAGRIVPQVERLLTTQTEDARLVLNALRDVVPSLLVALDQEGLDPDLGQDLIRLIEVITRLG